MTEQEWLNSTNPAAMIEYLWFIPHDGSSRITDHVSNRKLCMFAKACVEYVNSPFQCSENPPDDPSLGRDWTPLEWATTWALIMQEERRGEYRQMGCHLLRDIVGNPWQPVTLAPRQWLNCPWLTQNVLSVAQGIYEDLAFDHMPILHDALVDAGCDNEDVLRHCKGEERQAVNKVVENLPPDYVNWIPLRGPHVRGCWVLDLILGK
jgi:hypothetical protein